MRIPHHKKLPQRIIAGALLVCLVFMGLFYTARKTEAGWYDDNWAYRKAINITDHTTQEKNVYLNLTGASALDSQGASKTNCGDIRFTDRNGKVLPYYIVSGCKTATTVIHVFFETFPEGAQTIYYYYGNPSARDGFSLTDFSTAATGVTFGSYGSQEVGPGPVAYWKFDEGYGTLTNDNTSNGNGLTLSGSSLPLWATSDMCISEACLYFEGSQSRLKRSVSDFQIGDSQGTISMWVKPISYANSPALFVSGDEGSANRLFGVSLSATGQPTIIQQNNDLLDGVATINSIPLHRWTHLAFISTGTTWKIYINGTEQSTSVVTGSNSGDWFADTSARDNITVGVLNVNGSYYDYYFEGFIDDLKIYSKARSGAEIKSDFVRWASAEGSSTVLGSKNQYSAGPLSDGLVGYWKMDEASWNNNCSTATVYDYSGSESHGLSCPASTGSTGGSLGKFGNGAFYDYVDNYISINNSTVYAPMNSPFSASAWVYLNSFSDQYPTILRLRSDDTQPWFIIFSNQTNYLGVSIGNQANFAGIKTDVAAAGLTGKWLHVVATYNGKGSSNINNFKIYLDGALLTNSASGTYASHSQATSIGYNSSGNRWNGYIDEVRVYNRELTYDEAKNLYSWAPGPVGHWKMDEGAGLTTFDASGYGNNGTLTNSPTWSTGKFGGAVNLGNNTTNKYINVPDTVTLDGLKPFTFSTWVYFEGMANGMGIMGKSGNTQFYIYNSGSGFRPRFYLDFSTDFLEVNTTSTSNLLPNRWYHLAVTWDGSTNHMNSHIYINGVDQVHDPSSQSGVGTVNTETSDLVVGSTYSAANQLRGKIDETKMYNYARTPSQIIEDMNAGHPAPGSPVGSPLLHLSFDEGYGDTVYDSSGQLNHGNLSGSTTCPSASICPTWSNEGKFGKAMYFGALQTGDGDSHIRLANDTYDALTEGSLSFWFKSDGVGTDNDIFGAAEDDNGSGSDFVGVLFNAQDSMLNLGVANNGSLVLNVVTAAIPNPTAWHHAVVNMSASGHEIYVDGKKQVLSYFSGDSSTSVWFDDISEATTAYTVGCSDWNGSDTNDCTGNGFFAGAIDEFKLFTGPLTQEQVNIEYNRGVSQHMGSVSTTSDGVTASNASSREYCLPGDTSSCNSPILELKMDENTGTVANDSSGNNYSGSLIESTSWTQGKQGGGLVLNGLDNRVDVTGFSFPTSDYTYEAWIKPRSFSTSNVIFSGPTASVGGNEFMVDTDTDLDIDVISNGALVVNGTNGRITQNKWNHVAIVRSGTSITTYINGVVDITGTDGVSYSFASCPLTIGAQRASTTCSSISANTWFNGMLDDIRVYTYARTAGQIAWDYNNGAPTHIYKFNECQGTTVYNSAQASDGRATGLNGALTLAGNSAGTCESVTSTDTWYMGENGKYGAALALDGNDYAVVATPGLPTVDFTYAAWIYLDTINNDRPILKAADGAGANEIKLEIMANDGANPQKLRFAADGTSIYSSRTLETGRWYHIVGRRTNGTMEMFINGQKDSVTGSDVTTLNFSTCGLYIGAGPTSACDGGISTYFDGLIDDLRIYNYSLTETQIKTVINEGSAVRFGP